MLANDRIAVHALHQIARCEAESTKRQRHHVVEESHVIRTSSTVVMCRRTASAQVAMAWKTTITARPNHQPMSNSYA